MNHWLKKTIDAKVEYICRTMFCYNWYVIAYGDNATAFTLQQNNMNKFVRIHGDDKEDWIRQILEQLSN